MTSNNVHTTKHTDRHERTTEYLQVECRLPPGTGERERERDRDPDPDRASSSDAHAGAEAEAKFSSSCIAKYGTVESRGLRDGEVDMEEEDGGGGGGGDRHHRIGPSVVGGAAAGAGTNHAWGASLETVATGGGPTRTLDTRVCDTCLCPCPCA